MKKNSWAATEPYESCAKEAYALKKGATVKIIGKATNCYGNLWYKISNGTWMYSGNIEV